jgi:hypothetical protein
VSRESTWAVGTGAALIEAALLLGALVLVAVLAEGALAAGLALGVILVWVFVGLRRNPLDVENWTPRERRAKLVAQVAPVCLAAVAADALASDAAWFAVALVAIAIPLVLVSRILLAAWLRHGEPPVLGR